MKEYKVVNSRLGIINRNEKLETLLNKYALQGWQLKQIDQHFAVIVFERDKNR